MIGRLSALRHDVLQPARAIALAAGLLMLALALVTGSAKAGSGDAGTELASIRASAEERLQLAGAQALGRFSWRGGGMRFAAGRGGMGRPRGLSSRRLIGTRAVAYSWGLQAREVRQVRPPQGLYQNVQYGGRWGWRGGRGGNRGAFQAPDAAARALRNQGYSNVNPLTRRGRSYVGEATGPKGQRQRVIIDGNSGRVMGVSPLGPPVAMPPPGAGWYGGY